MVGVLSRMVLCILLPVNAVGAGCATTKPVLPVVEVRPVALINNGNFDLVTADKKAALFYKEGAFISAYTEYKNAVIKMPSNTGERKNYTALLGFADAALALSALGETYQDEARLVYNALINTQTSDTGLSKAMKARASAGLALVDALDVNMDADVGAQTHIEAKIMLALDATPNDPRLWNALGQVYDRKNNWVSALDSYVTALRLSHDRGAAVAPVQNNMGMSLLMQGRTSYALQKFKQAHQAHPDIQLYDNNHRLALVLSDKLAQAIEGLEEGRTAQLYNDAGYIAQGNGDDQRARALYERAILTSPVYFEIAEENLKTLG